MLGHFFNPDFPLGQEKTTQDSLMDFLWKFEGNRHAIESSYFQTAGLLSNSWAIFKQWARERRKMDKLTFKVIENRLMENLGLTEVRSIQFARPD